MVICRSVSGKLSIWLSFILNSFRAVLAEKSGMVVNSLCAAEILASCDNEDMDGSALILLCDNTAKHFRMLVYILSTSYTIH